MARRKPTTKTTTTYRTRQAAGGMRAGELFEGDETHPVVRARMAVQVGAEGSSDDTEAPPEAVTAALSDPIGEDPNADQPASQPDS